MTETMYGVSSWLIAGVLLVSMLVAIEVGYRLGRRARGSADDSGMAHINAVQASMLGMLALLIGFTFSLALQRFDSRSEAVVEEANAIGTAYLRTDLLPPEQREAARSLLREYLALRVRAGRETLVETTRRGDLLAAGNRTLASLWEVAARAVAADASPVRTGLFVQAVNELIDAYGRRDAALNRHVPELVLYLLYGTFILIGSIVGYACGIGGHRPSFATHILVALIVLLVFVIIDLDRPRRGLIEVDQDSLVQLQATLQSQARPSR